MTSLELYTVNGRVFQFEAGKQPSDTVEAVETPSEAVEDVEVPEKKRVPSNKARKLSNK